jgi:hypothetical protein
MRAFVSKPLAFARAALVMAGVAVVTPIVLMRVSAWRFGGRVPWHGVAGPSTWRIDQIGATLTSQLTERALADIVMRVALAIAWSAVVVFVSAVVAEAVHMARHDGLHLPDMRGLAWSQRGARVVAMGLLAVVPSLQPSAYTLAMPHGQTTMIGDTPELVAVPMSALTATATPNVPVPAAPLDGAYRVRSGDSVYGIAERLAGPDPHAVASLAERILDLNLGAEMANGERFTNAAYIDVGWTLRLPADVVTTVPPTAPPLHTVAVGESLWSIADDEMGDGSRWPELYEVNAGRMFDDGRTFDDPSALRPGWVLDLPVAETPPPGDVAPSPEPVLAAPAVVAPRLAVADHDAHHHDVAAVRDEMDVEQVTIVADGADRELAVELPARPENVWVTGVNDASSTVDRLDDAADDDDAARPLMTIPRASMLATGVLAVLAGRRRRRLRATVGPARVPEPSQRMTMTERALQTFAAGEHLARIDLAVRAAAKPLITAGRRPLALLAAPDGDLELLASGPVEPPAMWRGSRDRWTLASTVPTEMLAEAARHAAGAPSPALVQLGIDEHGYDVYVDLEALEALEIGGSPEQAVSIVASVAATMASSVWAETVSLISAGVPSSALLGHRLHRCVAEATAALQAAVDHAAPTKAMATSTFELRTSGTCGEPWDPAIVLVGSNFEPITPPTDRTGLGIVSASPIRGPSSRLAPDGDCWTLRPLGLRLRPIGLGPDDLAAIGDLLDVEAASVPIAPIREPAVTSKHVIKQEEQKVINAVDEDWTIYEVEGVSAGRARPSAIVDLVRGGLSREPDRNGPTTRHGEDWDLLVRLLGPVGVVDRAGEPVMFERSKTIELIAWLATHRDRATRANARTALWDQDVRDATFANVVSEARRALARQVAPPDGEEWVGRTLTESLPLHRRVRTDADLVAEAVAAARTQPPASAITTLRAAVALIGGVPFEGTPYLWPDAEGLTSNLILLATSAVAELSRLCLAVGDTDTVFAATARGLRVLPGHEELIGLRMRAHAQTGNHAGVRQEWNSYERVINADPWSDGEPSPKLVGLRKELLHPSL